ncbi:MAG: tetratricopeptide repeat protein [Tepidisphaeraceae bacterium]|jgi:tetratricopeptide (TPR) repeat protein
MAQLTIQQAFDLATRHHRAGRLHQAEQLYRQVLARQPKHAGAMQFLGVIAHQVGRNDMAVDLIHRAIALNPDNADAHNNLGNALKDKGQLNEAIDAYRQAIALKPNYAETHNNLGSALKVKGHLDEAIAAFRQAIGLRGNYAEAHSNLGIALIGKGQLDEAIAAFRRAIALRPNIPELHSNLSNALKDKGQLDEAIAACRRAIALNPNIPVVHINLGNVLRDKGQLDEAIAAFRRAVALNPNLPEAHSHLGTALINKGQLDEAIAAWRHAIALNPNFAEAHFNLSVALLERGDFQEGWEEHEWRWKCKDSLSPPRDFAPPQWDGCPLEGRTLLLHAEQGLGDALHFIRYLPLAAQRGGKIIIECQAELQRLFQSVAGGCQVVARGQPLPAFDLHCPLLSLPHVFRTNFANIPNIVPYLHADAEDAGRWQHRLAEHRPLVRVGLAWAGNPDNKNDRNRSIKLASLAPLGQAPGVRFFSLQKGEAAAQAKNPPPGMELVDWTAELKDFADTAALIANLDLVIAVDTAVAHLAGAMNKPVWTLLPFVPDWRWQLERQDSPWYPSMRLFRQPCAGNWDSVITRVVDALSLAKE